MNRRPARANIIALLLDTFMAILHSLNHRNQQTNQYHSPNHSYKLCQQTNHRAGSPVVTLEKSQHLQASGSDD
jgi:hypothetical protein